VQYIVDAQLPPLLAQALTQAGHASVAVRDVELREAEDESIWDYAARHGLAIVTKDEDFANLVWHSNNGPAVIWLRCGNTSNRSLLLLLLPLLDDIAERIVAGDRLIEVG
jgi:predicted nuclease of predicted toxin-antitoxin system